MLSSESSSRMWIDVVRELLPEGHITHERIVSITEGSIPPSLPLGDVAHYTLADSFGRMKGRDGRCKRRHGRRENIEYRCR
jgi:hypothetical protein